jgi:hypothetical protein
MSRQETGMTEAERRIVRGHRWPEAVPESVEVPAEVLRLLLAACTGHPWVEVREAAARARDAVFAQAAETTKASPSPAS